MIFRKIQIENLSLRKNRLVKCLATLAMILFASMAEALIPADLRNEWTRAGIEAQGSVEIYKRSSGLHERINDQVTWNEKLGYHSWLWGYINPGHSGYVSISDLRNLRLPIFLANASSFVFYQLHIAEQTFLKQQDPTAKLDPFLDKATFRYRTSEEFQYFKGHIKFNDSHLPTSGDIFFGTIDRLSLQNLDGSSRCRVEFGDILLVEKADPSFSTLVVVNQKPSETIPRLYIPGGCLSGQKIVVPNVELQKFNLKYWREAFLKNHLHRKSVDQRLGRYKTMRVSTDELNFCSGVPYSSFHKVSLRFLSQNKSAATRPSSLGMASPLLLDPVNFIFTNGSFENLTQLEQGVCDYGVFQNVSDQHLSQLAQRGYRFAKVDGFNETSTLFCKKDSQITDVGSIGANHRLIVGEPNSTSEFVFLKLAEQNPNLLKVRTVKMNSYDGMRSFFKEDSGYNCILVTQRDESSMNNIFESDMRISSIFEIKNIDFNVIQRPELKRDSKLDSALNAKSKVAKLNICSLNKVSLSEDFLSELSVQESKIYSYSTFESLADLTQAINQGRCDVFIDQERESHSKKAFESSFLYSEPIYAVCQRSQKNVRNIFVEQDDMLIQHGEGLQSYFKNPFFRKATLSYSIRSVLESNEVCLLRHSYRSRIQRYKDPLLLLENLPSLKITEMPKEFRVDFNLYLSKQASSLRSSIEMAFQNSILKRKLEP